MARRRATSKGATAPERAAPAPADKPPPVSGSNSGAGGGKRLLRPTALGKELGVTRQAIQQMHRIGMPHAAKDSKGYLFDPDQVRLWRARNVRTADEADRKSFDEDDAVTNLNDARIRLTVEQAALTALKRKQLEGELVEKERVVSTLGVMLGQARALIDQMPDQASRDICDAMNVAYAEKGPRVREAIRKVADQLLTRLANAADAADLLHAEVVE